MSYREDTPYIVVTPAQRAHFSRLSEAVAYYSMLLKFGLTQENVQVLDANGNIVNILDSDSEDGDDG